MQKNIDLLKDLFLRYALLDTKYLLIRTPMIFLFHPRKENMMLSFSFGYFLKDQRILLVIGFNKTSL